MKMHIPYGGFLAVRQEGPIPEPLTDRLSGSGADWVAIQRGGVLLSAWSEFSGQGLWQGPDGVVAYDLDLTNLDELCGPGAGGADGRRDPGEALWSLYQRHGAGFLDKLRGPFAFAIWDGGERVLLVATDPYGIRPVVYAEAPGTLVAGSRIRHVLAHPGVDRGLDPEAVYHYLFFSAIPSPVTIYRAVRKLPPGRFLHHAKGETRQHTHYDLAYRPDLEAGASYWRRAIPLAVRRAVARFVPLSDPDQTGCFLSGGTDSSTVAGYYGKLSGRPAKTFSIGFDEPGYNELDFAHLAVDRFGTEQHELFVTPEDVLSLVENLPYLYDEPFGNSSVVPAYYCAKMAKEAGVDTLLAGDGGDEIFGGNERYATNLVFEQYAAVPSVLRRRLLEPVLAALPGKGPFYKAQRYVRRANIPNPDRFYSYNLLLETDVDGIFQPGFLDEVDPGCFLRLAREHYRRAAPAHVTDRLLYLDMKFTITDNDLRKVTQMGEAAGVRIRYPLLDRDLVDFSTAIPPDLKVKLGKPRYMFKRAMEGFLPDEIIRKTKHGFGLPIGPWFAKNRGLSSLLGDSLFSGDPKVCQWVRPAFLQQLRDGFERGEVGYYGANLWVLLVLELWMRRAGEVARPGAVHPDPTGRN